MASLYILLFGASLVAYTTSNPSLVPGVKGELKLYSPSWPDWEAETSRWSTLDAPTFSAVFVPDTEEELSHGLSILTKMGVSFLATKAGGHGNARTMGSYQDVVQINLRAFRQAQVNHDNTITLGGGTRMEDLIPTLFQAGREMTVGSFPCVGVHGVMLGGGMGRLMGRYGLISDALISARVALWNGSIVATSHDVNPDLFWGIRGAGHNFGVVLESTYKTWPDKGGMHYNADMTFTDDSVENVFRTAKEMIEEGLHPDAFLIIGFVFDTNTNSARLMVNIVVAHDEEVGRKLSSKFSTTPRDAEYPIVRDAFKESMLTFEELGSGDALPGVCDVNLKNDLYTASSSTLFDVKTMTDIYHSYGAFVRSNPLSNRSILLFEASSGEGISALDADATAYAHRGKMTTNAIIQMTWDGEQETGRAIDAWGKSARDKLAKPECSGYDKLLGYVNYANKDEQLSALYGYEGWRHNRLSELKKKYDPLGFFNSYHAIPLEETEWDQSDDLWQSHMKQSSTLAYREEL